MRFFIQTQKKPRNGRSPSVTIFKCVLQVGSGRDGLKSIERLENSRGAKSHLASVIVTRLQNDILFVCFFFCWQCVRVQKE